MIPDRARGLDFGPVHAADADDLADLRLAAMRPSLLALGRFDPDRARQRFLAGFTPDETRWIFQDGRAVGMVVLRDKGDHLYLDHLYVLPAAQGRGTGRKALAALKDIAQARGLPLRLMALKGSAANRFYLGQGFALTGTEDWDNLYEYRPAPVSPRPASG
ncbi:GNAT family N-acetyltransferase [Actibacterium sp. D379-3]